MFKKILEFFIENTRINYALFVLTFSIGIWSYTQTPKEIFPSFELDMISIKGSYTGASVEMLDKLVVSQIESNIKTVDGVDEIATIISPNRFSMIIELKKGYNKYNISNKIKDMVSLSKKDLPIDMDEPQVTTLERTKPLIDISLTSKKLTIDQMKPIADSFKQKVLNVSGVSNATIFGDSDIYMEILLNPKKINALGLDINLLISSLSSLSYIFPIGSIEDNKKHFYISTYNGAKEATELANTILKAGSLSVKIKDIATISKRYKESNTLYSFNGSDALLVSITQQDSADAIKIVKKIETLLADFGANYNNIHLDVSDDNSKRIKERLNIVISNILLGIIMITILVAILINWRVSFIIALGIPTSFVMASIYFYFSGYTINMISLIGVLIALGIVVDDAIVVSENIQQYIEAGYEPKKAAVLGASEMVKPVTIASLTTIFSFLPSLMISGTMGEVMKLIPIALSALLVASLIESFIFLPIHAAHTLKNDVRVKSWDRANHYYNKIIHYFMLRRKSFLIIFLLLVPVLIVLNLKNARFQMFPKFDASDIKISIKADKNRTLEESFKIVQAIEQDLIKRKDDFFIKSIDSVAGYRRDSGNSSENLPYVMYMTLELQRLAPTNFVDKYITPTLSFYTYDNHQSRLDKSQTVSKKITKFLMSQNYKEKYQLSDIAVLEKKVGPIKSDIKIGLISQNNDKVIKHIDILTKKLQTMSGITTISNSVKYGVDEIKLKVNSYGEHLGITETQVGSYLSKLFSSRQISVAFDSTQLLEIHIKSRYKDDLEELKKAQIPLSDGTYIQLDKVCDISIKHSLEKIIKENLEVNFYIYANVNPDVLTASEALAKLDTLLSDIKNDGIKIHLKGEASKNKELKQDMILASILAITLIMLAILYLFNSFRETFILMSVIPFSFLGVLVGHSIMGVNLSMSAMIGTLGLTGVVINDGIIMMTYLKKAKSIDDIYLWATKRFRPIIITTLTTIIGMSSLIFFASGQAVIFQPIAIALGFGLAWGTVLNLIYLPVIYTFARDLK